jgi:dipeptidyl aminopeptidase B
MGLPGSNPLGYVNASISDVTAFRYVDYLVAHGSGDDNGECPALNMLALLIHLPEVHFANTAHLLDMFTQERIRNFRFRMFTDR